MRFPVIPTIIVGAAIATMVALGFWQLDRLAQKEDLIAQAERALTMSSEVAYPRDGVSFDKILYRRTTIECARVLSANTVAGRSATGQSGVVHRIECAMPTGEAFTADVGFSRDPTPTRWTGGEIRGTIAPGGRVVAALPLAGLAPLAPPDPRDIPNNHLAYAGQWFFFALTALVIYVLALRRKRTGEA